MASIRVAFANICQGLICEGKKNQRDVFSKHWPSAYRDTYASLKPDIMCFAEAPMDDQDGSSEFLVGLASDLGANYRADVHEKSWLLEGKYYGTAILSKFKIDEYETLMLPNPHFEVDNPDGSHWVLHDKTVQAATVDVAGTAVKLFNLHYFAFHRFKRDVNDPELVPSRLAFVEWLRLDDGKPTIVTGDFNNGDGELDISYPELFEGGRLTDAVQFQPEEFDEYYTGGKYQLDHVLYTNRHFCATHPRVVRDNSDHRGVLVDLELKV